MKITSAESTRAGQITPVSTNAGVAPPPTNAGSGSGPAASVQLSPQAQALAAAKTEAASYVPAVNAVPDRDDRVAELKSSIAAGIYQVSGGDIADQILRRSQADKITG